MLYKLINYEIIISYIYSSAIYVVDVAADSGENFTRLKDIVMWLIKLSVHLQSETDYQTKHPVVEV